MTRTSGARIPSRCPPSLERMLFAHQSGGLPVLLGMFLGAIALKRVFWARESVSYGAGLVRLALGRKGSEPQADELRFETVSLEPHGEVLLYLPPVGEVPEDVVLEFARERIRRRARPR